MQFYRLFALSFACFFAMRRFIFGYFVAFMCVLYGSITYAAEPEQVSTSIVERIESNGSIKIVQPEALSKRLVQPESALAESEAQMPEVGERGEATVVGYRIQVFSDANASTAKYEAQVKERNLISRFPTLSTYLTYKAPAWRLRVGDFKNREEAEEMMREIKDAFPSYSRELIIVRDRINL